MVALSCPDLLKMVGHLSTKLHGAPGLVILAILALAVHQGNSQVCIERIKLYELRIRCGRVE